MLVEKFLAPLKLAEPIGLASLDMSRLGQFVALTGANGAGKTRILSLLKDRINKRNESLAALLEIKQQAVNLETVIRENPGHASQHAWRRTLAEHRERIEDVEDYIFSTPAHRRLVALPFVPKELNLQDPRDFTQNQISNGFETARTESGLNGFQRKCFAYIQSLQSQQREATYSQTDVLPAQAKQIQEDYQRLQDLILVLLKARLTRAADGSACLFDKPLAEAGLSDGQKVLLQCAVAIHAQAARLNDVVFVMDEPENHLHPAALIEFLDTLSNAARSSQFWVATHSVPLLAHIAKKEPMSIWYVENGTVANAGRHPLRVLRGLLGDDEQIGALHDFAGLPAQLAAVTFAVESLRAPKSVIAQSEDPQVMQIAGLLKSRFSSNPVSILDFGAGKGRLLTGLAEVVQLDGEALEGVIDYVAFDESSSDREACRAEIGKYYPDPDRRYFNAPDQLLAARDDGSVDIVVLCNVLHEIRPEDWLALFGSQSLVTRALSDDGYLLIVEDQRIPVGEKAHELGFFVLDTAHLKTLFRVTESDRSASLFMVNDHREDGRLKAHLIAKSLLARITAVTRRSAIEQLQETAEREVLTLRRGGNSDYRAGQLHGFWSQQCTNALLYLKTQ